MCLKAMSWFCRIYTIILTKTTAAQIEVALSYHRVRGLYFMAVIFAATIKFILLHPVSKDLYLKYRTIKKEKGPKN